MASSKLVPWKEFELNPKIGPVGIGQRKSERKNTIGIGLLAMDSIVLAPTPVMGGRSHSMYTVLASKVAF